MPVVIARWPNGTFSVISAPVDFSMADLYWALDDEGDPVDAKLCILKTKNGWSHATFDWNREDFGERQGGEKPFIKFTPTAGRIDHHDGRLKKLKWPRGIVRWAYRVAFGDDRSDKRKVSRMSADEIRDFPAEPSDTFSVVEIRAMPSFCGVYFAYNDDGSCHYVGESKDVTSRVSGSRDEIGCRRIGVIECEPHERKRIEAYFVAMLNPRGNAISTHRMKSSRKDTRPDSLQPAAATGDGKTRP